MLRFFDTIRRSFSEFLALPFAMVAVLILLACGVSAADAAAGPKAAWSAWRVLLDSFIGDPKQGAQLMATVATSLVTMSSITFSILLLAVQQSSAALTNQVVDQYVRRRANQAFFGFFVGSSLFSVVCLALTKSAVIPVLAATLCLILAVLCLLALVVLIYTTLDQTRPTAIIATIHDTTVRARKDQAEQLVGIGMTLPQIAGGQVIESDAFGYLTWIDFERLRSLAARHEQWVIVIEKSPGAPVWHGEPIARIHDAPELSDGVRREVREALHIGRRRELTRDPAFGIDQLSNIGWTSVSTAKSNPAAGLVAIHALNDLLYRWGREGALCVSETASPRVYCRDALMDHLACAYESLMVVASESMQQQSLAEVSKGIARAFGALPGEMQDKLERAVLGSISALGEHVPTNILRQEIERLAGALASAGRTETAAKLRRAWDQLASASGSLHSRADRVKAA